ncbi:MAG: hypothetical protein ACK45H_09345, partial [Bacteroidota bacterium]
LKTLSPETIRDAGTVAEYFTDMISEDDFSPYNVRPEGQYSREPIDYTCFRISRAVSFEPLKDLDNKTIRKIRLKIGIEKLIPSDPYIVCSEDDRLNEIIRIGYGIKNGYINVRGQLYGY